MLDKTMVKRGGINSLHKIIRRPQLIEEYGAAPSRKTRIGKRDVYRLRHLENRALIVHLKTVEGLSVKEIADQLHISQKKVEWYLEWALQRTLQTPEEERIMPKVRNPTKKTSSSGATQSVSTSLAVTTPTIGTGIVSTPPSEDPEIQVAAFRLRTNMVPINEIADQLGITPAEAAKAIRIHADALNKSEISETEIARRIQVEQIDAALRSITPMVTGLDPNGTVRPKGVVLEAVDRFVRLLDAKAKLLGLNAPAKIDMEIRLQKIAEAGEYDFETLRAIFEEVVAEYPQLTAGV